MHKTAGSKATAIILLIFLFLNAANAFAENDANSTDNNQSSIEGKNGGLPTAINPSQFSIKEGVSSIGYTKSTYGQNPLEITDNNTIGIEAYASNTMLCSNQPSGQYCENWEASCNQTTWAYPYEYFYIYMREYDIFHNNQYNYSIRIDADDPNGEDIQWWDGSQYVDHFEYTYSGTGTWEYFCNQFGISLTSHTGQWRLKFRLHDNITGDNYYFSEYITIKCDNDSHCSSNQTCQSQQCITCTSHYGTKCYDDDIYWKDSCNRTEEIKEDCRVRCDEIYLQCINGCKANWNITAFDLWRNTKANATVQYDLRDGQGWEFAGQTNSAGELQFTKIDPNNCPNRTDIRAITAEGAQCTQHETFTEQENDTDTIYTLCQEANTNNQLHITMNSDKTEYLDGETIQLSFNVKDDTGNNVQGAFIGLIMPDESTATAPQTNTSGNSNYSIIAKEGSQKFKAIATKEGYKNASTETTVTVKEKPKTVIEVTGTDQLPIAGATIYINGTPKATTGPAGTATVAMPQGTNQIEVESEGESCGEKSTSQNSIKIDFSCDVFNPPCVVGWKCVNPSNLAYQFEDCGWTNTFYCKNGCKDDKCISNCLPIEETQAGNIRSTNIPYCDPMIASNAFPGMPQYASTALYGALYSFGAGLFVVAQHYIITRNTGGYDWQNFPEIDPWDGYLRESHYKKHVLLKGEFGNITIYEFSDICRDTLNDPNWIENIKYYQKAGYYNGIWYPKALTSFNTITGVYAGATPDGKIIFCFKPKFEKDKPSNEIIANAKKYLDGKVKSGLLKRLSILPDFVMILETEE